ncbi:MAG: hemerythrin domain-containing protein [Proteobacteria bacterium]|nr:hemerythrin domain-containing protein [Pseudomonadota bacterium]
MAKDAIALLKDDHETVKKLLKKLTETTTRATKKRQDLLGKIAKELEIHTTIEEEIFYPAFKAADGKEHDVLNYEAIEEHRAVDKLVLPDLQKTDPGTDQFSGRAKVLRELVEHHADEEEESMFPKARKTLSKTKLKELGSKMEERKSELKKKL